MKYIILLILTVIIFSNSFSQINTEPYDSPTFYLREFEIKELTNEVVNGSPYRYLEFSIGKVYFKMDDKPVNYLLNYNSYNNKIEFKRNDKTYSVTNSGNIEKVIINNDVLINLDYEVGDSISSGFFIELVKNKISLYKRDEIKFVPPREARNPYDNDEPAKFQQLKPKYYILYNGNLPHLIKNKKRLIQVFGKNSNLKEYIKNENIDLNSEEDLIKLMNYLNQ